MNKQIGFADFLERSLEGFDQSMRQFSQEPDCIREQDPLFVRKCEATCCWIKRGEKFIDREDVGAGHQIQQGRFPGIGITHNRRYRPLMSLSALPLHTAHFAHAFQLALKTRDPFLHPATINFQLCLAWSAGSNSAGLAGKMMPHSR